ncbi:WD repeat and SOCS box-containing 1-like [Paramuricea clavata]|uniref:WD repeat and SOCS box-containing 1-like n=1 Tax=Paramuricea clavata TaxID=317549 RepID=A0A7D9HHR9_PARCT|nr:WD repeat and SOCS box-containing 1-like [Paramuricea clavata]
MADSFRDDLDHNRRPIHLKPSHTRVGGNKMPAGKVILPSFEFQSQAKDLPMKLVYSPSIRCFLVTTEPGVLGFLDIDSKSIVKSVLIERELHYRGRLALSPDNDMIALASESEYHQRTGKILPNRLCICKVSYGKLIFLEPHFSVSPTTAIIYFPDGSKILVVNSHNESKEQSLGRMFEIPKKLSFQNERHAKHREGLEKHRNIKKLEFTDIPLSDHLVMHQNARGKFYEPLEDEDGCRNGFAVALSPDTTRILAGSGYGDLLIFDVNSLKVIQFMSMYAYYCEVVSCQYNPALAHHEFATFDIRARLRVWKVEDLEDDKEQIQCLRRFQFKEEPFGSDQSLSYSPDGALIALTSTSRERTTVICSHSGEILYTLVHKVVAEEPRGHSPACFNLFFGHLCQVAAVYQNNTLCCWKLPIVYSLKTLCLLMLRSHVRYNDVDQLPLTQPLTLRLRYLYV